MNRSAADAWTEELAEQIGMQTRITYRVPPTPSGVIDPVSVAREALVWLDDARAFDHHRRRAWQQLRDALELSLRELRPELQACLAPTVASIGPGLGLRQGAAAPDRLGAATEIRRILTVLDSGDALAAAWHDLIAV